MKNASIAKNICLHRQNKYEKKHMPLPEEKKELAAKHYKLAYYLVSKYKSRFISTEENVAEAFYTICLCAKDYKEELGFAFSTIAAKSWRRRLKRISDVYSARRNGYRVTAPWRQTIGDNGELMAEDIMSNEPEPTIDEPIGSREIALEAIADLPVVLRTILTMRMDGKSYVEIGRHVDMTKQGVAYATERAVKIAAKGYRARIKARG